MKYIFDQLYINGKWVSSSKQSSIKVIAPHTEEVIGQVAEGGIEDIDRAVAAAREAFDKGPWPRMSAKERATYMKRLSQIMLRRSPEIAEAITYEMGAAISWCMAIQVTSTQHVLDFYIDLLSTYAFEERRPGAWPFVEGSPPYDVIIRREAVGVVGAIVPWNEPILCTMFKVAPALAAGATMVIKPSPIGPLDIMMLAEMVEEAGIPPGVINVVPCDRAASERLTVHPHVNMIAFTGSTPVGRIIAASCGKLLKRCTLELGGNSPTIFLDDINIPDVVKTFLPSAICNNGQACITQRRLLVPRRLYSDIVDAMVSAFRAIKVGDPFDPATEFGPLATEKQRECFETAIQRAKQEGATIAYGGGRPAGLTKGWYVEPTILTNITPHMAGMREEIFGPALQILAYDTDEEAVAMANDSEFGLGGSVYSKEVNRALAIARAVQTGTISVNNYWIDFGVPFGGFKSSGIGRECGVEGLEEYLELKSITLPPVS